ncbi:MAG: hypothetical protein AAGK17_04580 [Pseudomonadota bacterium]
MPSSLQRFWQDSILRDIPWKWALWWLVLPNLAFILMWPVGGPMMADSMLFCGIIALAVMPVKQAFVRRIALVFIYALQLTIYITKSFNIDFWNITLVREYLVDLSITKSPEYIVAGLVIAATVILSLRFGARMRNFANRNEVIGAIGLVAILINADTFATEGTRGSYKASAPAGTPVESAIIQTGISPDSVAADNLVIIMVESWGVPTDPHDKALDDKIWAADALEDRFTISRGKSLYFGSTTNGEMRELCGIWGDHLSTDFDKADCLPKQFRDAGFSTKAYHTFGRTFFGRFEWYPKLGFEEVSFESDLKKRGARHCDGVFAGACDADIPKMIAADLRNSETTRNLVYWLTLNAHLPVAHEDAMGTGECGLGDAEWREDFPMLCRSYMVHKIVADAIYDELSDPAFPEADVLIIGDHMPPFFQRSIRTRFDAAHVPWIYLENKAARQPSEAEAVIALRE